MSERWHNWHQARTGKWHAFAIGVDCESVCGYVRRRQGKPIDRPPAGACTICCGLTKTYPDDSSWERTGVRVSERSDTIPENAERVLVECKGGALDGTKLRLLVVRDGPDCVHVIARTYERPQVREPGSDSPVM